jgi:C_GCAxxG_C_C family probable redox protein
MVKVNMYETAKNKTTGLIVRDGRKFNCCESTMMLIDREHPLPGLESNIIKAATSFGGGIYWGSLCGAPAGMAMAMGLVYGAGGEESLEEYQTKKAHCNEVCKSLMRDFEEAFGSINCNDLLDVDYRTEDGRARLKDLRDAKGYVMCDEYVDWAANRALEILGEG